MEGCLFEGFSHWGLENPQLFLGTKHPLPSGICCPTLLLPGCLSRLSVPKLLWLGLFSSFVPALQSALRLVLYLSMFVLFLSLEFDLCWVWIWIKSINVGKFYLCSSKKVKYLVGAIPTGLRAQSFSGSLVRACLGLHHTWQLGGSWYTQACFFSVRSRWHKDTSSGQTLNCHTNENV